MKSYLQERGFDELDKAILRELQTNARISNADLARKIHLSQPAVHNRIKRLERKGIIRQYTALLDSEVTGYDLTCYVQIAVQGHSDDALEILERTVCEIPEILECHYLTGEYNVLLKIVVHNRTHLDELIHEQLGKIPNVDKIQTNIVMREVKATTILPVK